MFARSVTGTFFSPEFIDSVIAPYMYCETDRDNQGYRKKAYIKHFHYASVFPSIYGLSLIFIFSLWLFFTLCLAIV